MVLLCAAASGGAGCLDRHQRSSHEATNAAAVHMRGGDVARAEAELRQATLLAGDNHVAWCNLGHVHARKGRWQEAALAYAEAASIAPQNASYDYFLGRALFEMGNPREAELALRRAIAGEPRLYKAHWYLGHVYQRLDQPRQAALAWTEGARRNPRFGRVFIDLAQLYRRWDKKREAIAVLEQAGRHVTDERALSDIYYYLGQAYSDRAQWQQAIDAFDRALGVDPDNREAQLQRGFAYASTGDRARARADLEAYLAHGKGEFAARAAQDRLIRLALE